MKRIPLIRACGLVLALAMLAPTLAPAAVIAAAPQQDSAAAAGGVVLPDGTELTVVTTEEISSKTAVEGDALTFKVDDDVKINGKTVIARGSIVKGEISNSKKSGRMGKGGQLSIRILSTEAVDGQKVKLRASKGREGDDKTGTTVALVVLFGPLGFLKKGKDAKIKEGTRIKAYTDEVKTVAVAN
jgi:hypothetical protein